MGYNYIRKNLAMGSLPNMGVPLPFDTLYLTAIECQYPHNLFVVPHVIYAPLNDDGTPITTDEVKIASKAALDVVRRLHHKERVLVTCYKGKNRSGLVCALALIFMGMHPDLAIHSVRYARGSDALSNRYFTRLLRGMYRLNHNSIAY